MLYPGQSEAEQCYILDNRRQNNVISWTLGGTTMLYPGQSKAAGKIEIIDDDPSTGTGLPPFFGSISTFGGMEQVFGYSW